MIKKLRAQRLRNGIVRSRHLFLTLALFVVGLSTLPHVQSAGEPQPASPAVAIISLVPSIRYQTMRGWEATAQAGQLHSPAWNNYKGPLLNSAVDDLGLNRMRLEINSGVENPTDYFSQWQTGLISESQYNGKRFEIINDDSNPNSINPNGFKWSSLDSTINEVILPLRSRLQARGESLWVNVNYVDFGSSAFEHKNSPEEYAEFVLATYHHMQSAFGFVPDSWEVVLEPDTSTANWSASQVAQAIRAAGDKLAASGFTPNFTAPSTVNGANAPLFIDQMAQTAGAMQYVGEFSYHRYCCVFDAVLQSISNRAVQYGKQSAMLEWISADFNVLHEDIRKGRNSSWQQYCLAGPVSWGPDGGDRYYIIDDSNANNPVITMGSRTKLLRQYFKFIRSGAERIEATSNNTAFDPLAFINRDGKYVVVVKAASGGSMSISALPPGTYGVKYSTATQYDVDLASMTILDGQPLGVAIPDAGVITMYAEAGPAPTPTTTPGPPTTPMPTGTPVPSPTGTPTTGPTATATPVPTPSPLATPTTVAVNCTPSLTVNEVFPGSLTAFSSITAGPNRLTIDVADTGVGLQGVTLVSSTNANVDIPGFSAGTYAPVTAVFSTQSPALPTDFTLRASARSNAILITARCAGGPVSTPTPGSSPTPAATPSPNPIPTPTQPPATGLCTPALTLTEVFPGSLAAFQAITPGPGTITVDAVDDGVGLQGFTSLSASNANVSIPLFQTGTTSPVTATFTMQNSVLPVDFTLRASQLRQAVVIRAQCGG